MAPTPGTLRPGVGFCLQAKSSGTPPGRWFLNMTMHKLVEMPRAYSGQKVTKEWILANGIANLQVPFDMGSFRKVKGERAEGARHTTWCIDVVFNPLIVQLFIDDGFCNAMESFRPFVIGLTLKRIEESLNVKLVASSIKLIKEFRYKDGEDGGNSVPREFRELPDDQDCFDEELPRAEPPSEAPPAVLIEDITPGYSKPPVLKKGFLKSGKADLYGPEGSKEGVLPENAGDPLGYIPKGLRKQCKIVDTGSPEYQAQQKEREAAEENNRMQQEFRDSILGDLDKWTKKAEKDRWEADLPDGTEPTSTAKYNNDYSRFDSIVEEPEKQELEKRDYYFDQKGVPQKFDAKPQKSGTDADVAQEVLQKGFLENAKKALYPKGSEQAPAAPKASKLEDIEQLAKLSEGELMERVADMSPDEKSMMDDLRSLIENKVTAATASPSEPSRPKEPERQAADHSLTEGEGSLLLAISVPELDSMKGVDLDVTKEAATVVFPASANLRPLQVKLPKAVLPSQVRAKFSRKTHQINVTMPTE